MTVVRTYAHYFAHRRDCKVLVITPNKPSLFGPREEILVSGLAQAKTIASRRGSCAWNFLG